MISYKFLALVLVVWFFSPIWLPAPVPDLTMKEMAVAENAIREARTEISSLMAPKIVVEDVFVNPYARHHLIGENDTVWEVRLKGYTWFHIPLNRMRIVLEEGQWGSLYGSFRSPRHNWDDELIEMANRATEARMFLEKYPEAEIRVDRSGRRAVDYRVDKYEMENGGEVPPYLRLRIFIDTATEEPAGGFIECSNVDKSKIYESDIIGYLEVEQCLE